jgi:sugar-specific transcriptional regulator TrmB
MRRLTRPCKVDEKGMHVERGDLMSNVFSTPSAYRETPRVNGMESIVRMLNAFELSEKEARLYVHLLKYGPKRASDLAESLKTYRLEIYRKLTSLVNKNMVSAKTESPAVYSAVELDNALDNALLSRQREIRSMEKIRALLERVNGIPLSLREVVLAIDDHGILVRFLTSLGLSEKEARLYVHLLKYGPKRASDLAQSLKTYREDVYRRFAHLEEVGLATKTSEDSSRYVPVELDRALNNVILNRQRKLDRLQSIKQKLVEDISVTFWHNEYACSSFKPVKTVGELVTTISQLINSAEASVLFIAHPQFNLFSMGGFREHFRYAVARGIKVRGILDIHATNFLVAREYLSCGVELRHKDRYRGMTMVVADGKRSVSLIYPYLKSTLSLDENVAALRSDGAAQATFLTNAFEMTWTQATNAEDHIDQQQRECYNEIFVEYADKNAFYRKHTAGR